MKKWSENLAVSKLVSNGAEVKGKMIIARNGLKGLSTCSALDYLINHCGYNSSL